MSDEILIKNEEQPDEKELLRKRKEEQVERVKAQYQTDVEEKAQAEVRMKEEAELERIEVTEEEIAEAEGAQVLPICAELEAEISSMTKEEKEMYFSCV